MDSTDHQVLAGTKMEPLNRSHSISEDNNPTYNGGSMLRQYAGGIGNMDTLKNGGKMSDFNTATYNKYTDAPIQLRHDDLNSQKAPVAQPRSPIHQFNMSATAAALSSSPPITRNHQTTNAASAGSSSSQAKALVIGTDVTNLDRVSFGKGFLPFLAMSVSIYSKMSFCFRDIALKFCIRLILPKKLLLSRNRRHWATIT